MVLSETRVVKTSLNITPRKSEVLIPTTPRFRFQSYKKRSPEVGLQGKFALKKIELNLAREG